MGGQLLRTLRVDSADTGTADITQVAEAITAVKAIPMKMFLKYILVLPNFLVRAVRNTLSPWNEIVLR